MGAEVLLSDHVLFVHAPKTAGMSVTDYLIANLPGHKLLTVPAGHGIARPDVTVQPGRRHATLAEAASAAEARGRPMAQIPLVLGIIRNPYDIEVSRYHYLRQGHPWDAGVGQRIAMEGDFDRFVREVPYPWKVAPRPIEEWYTIDGAIPANMRLARFETLADDLAAAIAPFCRPRHRLQRINATGHRPWQEHMNPVVEQLIWRRHAWLFQFYPRFQPSAHPVSA